MRKPNDLICPWCGGAQFVSDAGVSCEKGHGNVRGLTPKAWKFRLDEAERVLDEERKRQSPWPPRFPELVFQCDMVAPGASTILVCRPVETFWPKKLVPSPETAGAFELLDLRIGGASQMVRAESVSFLDAARLVELERYLDVVPPEVDFALEVRCTAEQATAFRLVVLGTLR